jgi:hypothetical protein
MRAALLAADSRQTALPALFAEHSLLSRFAPVQDLLLSAKHLFVAARWQLPLPGGSFSFLRNDAGSAPTVTPADVTFDRAPKSAAAVLTRNRPNSRSKPIPICRT